MIAEPELNLFKYIIKLARGENLSAGEVSEIFEIMVSGKSEPVQVSSLLTLLYKNGETPEEIFGFAQSMLKHAIKIHPQTCEPAIDTCGTGGDNLNTINISTASSFVLAAGGIPIAKHGNRSITSRCGSADLLESMGIKIDLEPEKVRESIEKINIGFMFAPLYHPAMRHLAPIRKNLPFRTVFNLLGPLANPAQVKRQVTGVFHPDLIIPMITALKKLGSEKAIVFSGEIPQENCYIDEVSPFGKTHFAMLDNGEITTFEFEPLNIPLRKFSISDLKGTTAQGNAQIIESIFREKLNTPVCQVIKLNSACAFYLCGKCDSIESGFEFAGEIIESGRAFELLEKWRGFI